MSFIAEGEGVHARDQLGPGWTVVLRRQPARIVGGQPEGGYTDAFEIICADCGDNPDLDYREVSSELQRLRGPYPIAAGVRAYERHVGLHHKRQTIREADSRQRDARADMLS